MPNKTKYLFKSSEFYFRIKIKSIFFGLFVSVENRLCVESKIISNAFIKFHHFIRSFSHLPLSPSHSHSHRVIGAILRFENSNKTPSKWNEKRFTEKKSKKKKLGKIKRKSQMERKGENIRQEHSGKWHIAFWYPPFEIYGHFPGKIVWNALIPLTMGKRAKCKRNSYRKHWQTALEEPYAIPHLVSDAILRSNWFDSRWKFNPHFGCSSNGTTFMFADAFSIMLLNRSHCLIQFEGFAHRLAMIWMLIALREICYGLGNRFDGDLHANASLVRNKWLIRWSRAAQHFDEWNICDFIELTK